jgi:hypothetical protein
MKSIILHFFSFNAKEKAQEMEKSRSKGVLAHIFRHSRTYGTNTFFKSLTPITSLVRTLLQSGDPVA